MTLKTCLTVIGTRQPSVYGRSWARRLGAFRGRNKIEVIGGLALGCEAEARRGVLATEGFTLAVSAMESY